MLSKSKKLKKIIISILILCILTCLICVASVNAYDVSDGTITISGDLDIRPADYEIVPIDDGVVVIQVEGWMNLIYWKEVIPILIGSYFDLFEPTELGDFTRKILCPTIGLILSGAIVFILFSRRNSPEKNPNSAPAKILAYVEKHQGSTQQKIIDAVSRSRGSVAYQLKRLEKEKKIYTCTVSDKKYYFTNPVSANSLEFEIMKILADENLREIFTLLYNNKKLTRNSIAKFLKKSPDTVYYHLKKISQDIIIQNREGHADCYSLTEKARTVYSMMGIDGCVNEAKAEA